MYSNDETGYQISLQEENHRIDIRSDKMKNPKFKLHNYNKIVYICKHYELDDCQVCNKMLEEVRSTTEYDLHFSLADIIRVDSRVTFNLYYKNNPIARFYITNMKLDDLENHDKEFLITIIKMTQQELIKEYQNKIIESI